MSYGLECLQICLTLRSYESRSCTYPGFDLRPPFGYSGPWTRIFCIWNQSPTVLSRQCADIRTGTSPGRELADTTSSIRGVPVSAIRSSDSACRYDVVAASVHRRISDSSPGPLRRSTWRQ